MNNKALKRLMTVLTTLESDPRGLSAEEIGEITGYTAGLVLTDLNDISFYTDFCGYFTLYTDEDEEGGGQEVHESVEDGEELYRIKNTRVKWHLLSVATPYPTQSLDLAETSRLCGCLKNSPPQKGCSRYTGSCSGIWCRSGD